MADWMEGKPAEASAPSSAPRAGQGPAEAGASKKAVPDAGPEPGEPNRARRRLIWTCIWGYLGVNFLMFLRFFFPRTLFEPSTVFSVGYPTDFNEGVDTKFQQQYRVWVVRSGERLFVIYARCTHLGCTPDWKQSEDKFKCPCHGSGYDREGINFEGPAPRPMDRAHVELDSTGQIIVDTGRLYVKDPTTGKNEFNDPNSFLVVG
jgi:cytochrome b6-f complex iron-sulfur subunit